jgi:hypothetical protein
MHFYAIIGYSSSFSFENAINSLLFILGIIRHNLKTDFFNADYLGEKECLHIVFYSIHIILY